MFQYKYTNKQKHKYLKFNTLQQSTPATQHPLEQGLRLDYTTII